MPLETPKRVVMRPDGRDGGNRAYNLKGEHGGRVGGIDTLVVCGIDGGGLPALRMWLFGLKR